MEDSKAMGLARALILRVAPCVAAVAVCVGLGLAPAQAEGASPAPPAPTTTTTLPALPQVAPAYTNGQPAASLLANAIALASVGVDDAALSTAVSTTQARLDADQQTADMASRKEAAARRVAASDQRSAAAAQRDYNNLAGAVRAAAIDIYIQGPGMPVVSQRAGALAVYAQDYAASTVTSYGALAARQTAQHRRQAALGGAKAAEATATREARLASAALADQQSQLQRLERELAAVNSASASAVAGDHVVLADEAGAELLAESSLQFTPKTPLPVPLSTTSVALTWAFAELGRPYVWGATGPGTFDCSGLTQFVWRAAGVTIPRVAADQYSWTVPVPLSQLLPGDLVFFGSTDIHHVGIYIGDGLMINAPHTGTVVQVSSIWWSDLAGFGRVHFAGIPVPAHNTPTAQQPAAPEVVPAAGPVPSQTAPPAGWKPGPGETTPIPVAPSTTTTTTVPVSGTTTTTTSTTTVPGQATTTTSVGSTTTTSVPATTTTTAVSGVPMGAG